jgi:hypothetical protein
MRGAVALDGMICICAMCLWEEDDGREGGGGEEGGEREFFSFSRVKSTSA